MNPIKPDDLFSSDFTQRLDEVVANLEKAYGIVTGGLENVRSAATKLANTPIASGQAEATKKWASSVQALSDDYRYLLQQFGIYKTEIEQVTTVQRDQNALMKLQKQYADAQSGSFNKLSAEYRLLKIAMNALDAQSLKNTENFKRLQQRAEELYQTMNKYQQSTGKFGMQVGDYSKALNGLNISTQQVLRELPTLANSLQQFFIAISNNVPIFVDNFQRARAELGSFGKALGATVKVIFSWQTALLVLLTVLPKIAKAIHDKRKAQEEANKETKEAFDREKELLSLEENIAKAEAKSVAELQTLYRITQDVTRSEKERAEATSALQQLYPEHLSNYSQEEILAGKAKGAVDDLTDSLILQARARGYLNEIEKLSQQMATKQIELTRLKTKQAQQQTELDKATAKANKEGWTVMGGGLQTTAVVSPAARDVDATKSALDATSASINNLDSELQDVENTIQDIIDLIPTGVLGVVTDGGGKGRTSKEKEKQIGEIADYTLALYDAMLEGMEDGVEKMRLQRERDVLALTLQYKKDYEKLEEQEKLAIDKKDEAVLAEIRRQMGIRRKVYQQEIANLATDAEIEAKFAPKELIDPLADVRKAYRDALVEMRQFSGLIQKGLDEGRTINAEELADWQETIRKKILAEANYQKAKKELELRGRLDAKQISQDEYNDLLAIESAKIDTAASKALDKVGVSKGKKWNIWTALFGTDVKDETTGTITRIIGQDTKFALDQVAATYKNASQYLNEYIDSLVRLAEQAVETANAQVEASRTALDAEIEARNNGYANSVDTARKEYETKLRLQKEAQAEAEKIQKTQQRLKSLTQASNLLTATTSIIKSYASLPFVGQALAIAGLAAMWGTFAAAKIKASQITTYGEGMSEYLDYGGSHASGNDIDFGVSKDGKRRRVERGEVIGVINKKNVSKYGANTVTDIIDSLNKGNFEYKYGKAFSGAIIASQGKGADLNKLENGVDALVRQGEYRETYVGGKRIIQYKNLTRRER